MPSGMGPFSDRKKLREFVNHMMDTLEDQKIIGFRLQADTGGEHLLKSNGVRLDQHPDGF